ncbi:glycosyltransferase family 39 protein, partial [Candidatus Sumerlaeota bacterium]|nr:glycosyltransferase family 39 protein [Candidatus Sumerlaeota bacterium]
MNDSRVSKNQTLTIVALASALVVGLPFLNKPFHIDDTFVLAIAEQICRDPLRPYSASFNWFSDPQPIFDISTNPPFLSYWLAPALAIFGPSEIAMHLAMLPFLILLALSVAALSRRFAQGSIWPVLFVMFSPAVVVSPNIMRDVPAAALVTAGIALFVAGTDQNRWFYAICGALLAGLSSTAKYSTLILIPVMALYPIFMRKPRFLLALLASFAAPGLWFLQNYMVHGKVHFLTMQSAEKANISLANMALAALVITGASFFLVPVFVVQHVVRFWRCAQALAAALILAVLLPSWIHKVNPAQQAFQYYLWAT